VIAEILALGAIDGSGWLCGAFLKRHDLYIVELFDHRDELEGPWGVGRRARGDAVLECWRWRSYKKSLVYYK
jgi:hypothetical protein